MDPKIITSIIKETKRGLITEEEAGDVMTEATQSDVRKVS